MTRRTSEGFTLVEILIVVALVALLAAILIPVVSTARQKSNVAACVAQIRRMGALAQSPNEAGGLAVWPLTVYVTMPDGTTYYPPVSGPLLSNPHHGHYDTLGAAARLDQVFLSLGLMDRLFETPLVAQSTPTGASDWAVQDLRWDATSGTFFNSPDAYVSLSWDSSARVECGIIGSLPPFPGAPTGAAGNFTFKLDGYTEAAPNQRVVFVVLPNVTASVAFLIAQQFDGAGLMDSEVAGAAQTRGPATYAVPVDGVTTVFIFLAAQ